MSLPRYSEYKDSGVEWLGEIPMHWDVVRYKNVFKERDERSADGSETLLSVSAYTGVSPRSEIIEAGEYLSRAESLEGYKVCHPDDLVMNIMLAWNRGLGVTRHHGIVSPAYSVFQVTNDADPKFLDYMMRSDQITLYYKAFSSGVIDSRLRLYPDTFGSMFCVLPPSTEQVAIATFLDRETAKIDALIVEQEKLLALLAEKRQATISHAVTRGLNPNVPMKDSGIPWLGQVPANWKVTKCGRFTSILSGFAFPSSGFNHEGEGIRLLRGVNVGVSTLRWDDVVYWERRRGDGLDEYELKVGDLVIGMDRPLIAAGIRVAKVGEPDVPCLLLQRVALLRTSVALNSDLLMHFLSAPMFVAHFSPETTGVSVPHISPEQIASFVIAVPPIGEQERIVQFLAEELDRLSVLSTNVTKAIDLLKERRSALIAAAVTGQIDVRGAVEGMAA